MNLLKLIATLMRVLFGSFGLVFVFDGLVCIYAEYSLGKPDEKFILWILHESPWLKTGLGIICIAAALLLRAAAQALTSKGGGAEPSGKSRRT